MSRMFNMLNDFLKVPWSCIFLGASITMLMSCSLPCPLFPMHIHFQHLGDPQPLSQLQSCQVARSITILSRGFFSGSWVWITLGLLERLHWGKTDAKPPMCTYVPVALFAWMARCKFSQAAASSVLKSVNRTSIKRFRFQQQHQNWPS